MVWTPGNNQAICAPNSCNAIQLAFLQFLIHQMGFSYDTKFKELNPDDGSNDFDFIIVGAGPAGSVVANRLSEINQWKILLLEAGDEEPLITAVPGLTSLMSKSSLDYNYTTQPDPNACNGLPCQWPRGKVMGGCSNFYSSHFTRGNKWDYENWEKLGNEGWSWNKVLKYFKKSEDMTIETVLRSSYQSHGVGGYQRISGPSIFDPNADVILRGWKEVGLREVDYNSGDNNKGTSRTQYSYFQGSRLSANGAFIRPIRGVRKNLTVRPNSKVTRILINPATKEAEGVEYKAEGSDKVIKAFAQKEVILSAGSIDSPKLLMLSGIGPAENLKKSGIAVVNNLPVGRNLHNHVSITHVSVKVPSNNEQFTVKTMYKDLLRWLPSHQGPMSLNPFMDNIAFLQTKYENSNAPDIQTGYIKIKHDDDTNSSRSHTPYYDEFRLTTLLLNPRSRGYLELDPSNPQGNPLIYPKYFSDSKDLEVITEGALLNKRLAESKEFGKAGFKISKVPAPLCDHLTYATPDYYQCLAKKYTGMIGHLVGTCKMGRRNESSTVVDSRLRVVGVKKLRVIDASIMPVVPRGNTYAPTVMIGEKGSDMIKEDYGLLKRHKHKY